jgi:hypothetical protein
LRLSLEHTNAQPARRQQRRDSQAADTSAYHDYVIGAGP